MTTTMRSVGTYLRQLQVGKWTIISECLHDQIPSPSVMDDNIMLLSVIHEYYRWYGRAVAVVVARVVCETMSTTSSQ
jgi:hypothetical protein